MSLRRRAGLLALSLFLVSGFALAIATLYYKHVQKRRSGEAQRILDQADDLSWNNRWFEAEPLYKRADALFLREGDKSRALYAHVSQVIAEYESSSIPDSIFALTADLSLPEAQDPETRLRILNIRGMLETNYDAALAQGTWAQVASLARAQGHFLLSMRAVGELGIAEFILGDIASAKRDVLAAWTTAKVSRDYAAHVRYASVYGYGLVELKRYKEALIPINEALTIAKNHPAVAYPFIALDAKINALRGLHQYDEALALSKLVISQLSPISLKGHTYQLLSSQGSILQDMHNLDGAIADYKRASDDAHDLKYWRGIAEVGGSLAQAQEEMGRLPDALASIDDAIEANKRVPDELYLMPRNLAIKAEIVSKMGQRAPADALYKKSTALIDEMLAHVPTRNVERILLDDLSKVYSSYFVAQSTEHDYSGALAVIEAARGRIEAEGLRHHDAVIPHAPTPEEQRLTTLNLALVDTNDPQERQKLISRIYDAELALAPEQSIENLTANHPVTLTKLQSDLSDDEALLEYVLASPRSYTLVVTKHRVEVVPLADQTIIEDNAVHYRDELRSQKTDDALAAQLYDQLLAPIAEVTRKSKLIIVPDGSLHLLPFDALMHGGKYVLATHTISTAPSSTVFSLLRNRHSHIAQALPYVGVAAWTNATSPHKNFILRAIAGPERDELTPLPQSKLEVETIATDLPKPSTILLGTDATETKFKSLPLDRYNVLHLALHGYVDNDYPDRSALVFAPQHTPTDDGLLQVREIRRLHLNAALVTLSACNTGVGPVSEAGVANLVNSFIEAGADSVVSTLWELEDRSTALLMTDFYKHLGQHESKAAALRDAQLDLISRHFAPYYWASYELVGDPSGTI